MGGWNHCSDCPYFSPLGRWMEEGEGETLHGFCMLNPEDADYTWDAETTKCELCRTWTATDDEIANKVIEEYEQEEDDAEALDDDGEEEDDDEGESWKR